jgi:hypothetical protein
MNDTDKFVLDIIIELLQMNNWESERKRATFFHQKGWIANNFKVKNNVAAILKSRRKNITETDRP